ncbi:MAG: hypothetical protein OEZ10_02030 [Gammaproteobacteria bacterium]|nr:hypothetical protein [Gammaproteobacteria bacterium]
MNRKKIVGISAISVVGIAVFIPLLLYVLVGVFSYFISDNTQYCPISHKLNDLSVCHVLDKMENRILLQHGDLDTNWFYLEVIDNGKSYNYKFPKYIKRVGKGDYSANLIVNETRFILVNGKKYKLEKYVGRTE